MSRTATILANASQVVTCAGVPRARRGPEMKELAIQSEVAVVIVDESIGAVGQLVDLRRQFPHALEIDCERGVLTPGLVDSHTHAIFGRPRYDEQELRAAGMGFDRIAAQLSGEGLKTRTGARWHGLVINRILTGKGRKAA